MTYRNCSANQPNNCNCNISKFLNIVDKSADSATGLLNDGSKNKWDTQIAYTRPQYHASLTLSNAQNWTSQSYNATSFGAAMLGVDGDTTGYALRGYWRPLETGSATINVEFD